MFLPLLALRESKEGLEGVNDREGGRLLSLLSLEGCVQGVGLCFVCLRVSLRLRYINTASSCLRVDMMVMPRALWEVFPADMH